MKRNTESFDAMRKRLGTYTGPTRDGGRANSPDLRHWPELRKLLSKTRRQVKKLVAEELGRPWDSAQCLETVNYLGHPLFVGLLVDHVFPAYYDSGYAALDYILQPVTSLGGADPLKYQGVILNSRIGPPFKIRKDGTFNVPLIVKRIVEFVRKKEAESAARRKKEAEEKSQEDQERDILENLLLESQRNMPPIHLVPERTWGAGLEWRAKAEDRTIAKFYFANDGQLFVTLTMAVDDDVLDLPGLLFHSHVSAKMEGYRR